eukprot:TRINITY_DN4987_c0_g1_i3.p1 TRINITY_DN4987_c0_g1~~TRINITY_DN4987_c0_g1_i3.p1  ORF type:complete len:344 (-),score=78.09 TRINITY_DN4987_c0_g1_i3:80-1111(-)
MLQSIIFDVNRVLPIEKLDLTIDKFTLEEGYSIAIPKRGSLTFDTRPYLDLIYLFHKFNRHHAIFNEVDEFIKKNRLVWYKIEYEERTYTSSLKFDNYIIEMRERCIDNRIKNHLNNPKRRVEGREPEENGRNQLQEMGMDVWRQIFSHLNSQVSSWLNIMLVCKQMYRAGKEIFDPNTLYCGEYPIAYSAARGQIDSVKYLLSNRKVNARIDDCVALRQAVKYKQDHIVQLLLSDKRLSNSHSMVDQVSSVELLKFLWKDKRFHFKEKGGKACFLLKFAYQLNDEEMIREMSSEVNSKAEGTDPKKSTKEKEKGERPIPTSLSKPALPPIKRDPKKTSSSKH